jgi:hypothetical protein
LYRKCNFSANHFIKTPRNKSGSSFHTESLLRQLLVTNSCWLVHHINTAHTWGRTWQMIAVE